jgi:hypothetical protein
MPFVGSKSSRMKPRGPLGSRPCSRVCNAAFPAASLILLTSQSPSTSRAPNLIFQPFQPVFIKFTFCILAHTRPQGRALRCLSFLLVATRIQVSWSTITLIVTIFTNLLLRFITIALPVFHRLIVASTSFRACIDSTPTLAPFTTFQLPKAAHFWSTILVITSPAWLPAPKTQVTFCKTAYHF